MATKKKIVGTSWVHRAAGLACQFQAQDNDRLVVVDYTTILGSIPQEDNQEPLWIVHVQGTETESRGEYSWPIEEFWTVTHNAEGEEVVDEATAAQVAQVKAR
jgi:hypothetical protein